MIITFELAFLITLLTVFNVVELLVAHIDLGELNENVPLNIFSKVAGNRRRYLGCAKGGNRETGDWKQQTPCGWPVTSAFDIRYILADNAVRATRSRFCNDEV